jgi:hypothetical protein
MADPVLAYDDDDRKFTYAYYRAWDEIPLDTLFTQA